MNVGWLLPGKLLWVVALLCAGAALAPGQRPVVRFGIVMDGPASGGGQEFAVYEKEISELLGEEYEVRFPESKRIEADWSSTGVKAALDRLLADPEVDQVFASGLIGSHVLARSGPLMKPGHAALIIDAALQGLPIEERAREVPGEHVSVSGVQNLTYILGAAELRRDIEVFRQLVPFTRLAVLYTDSIEQVFPELSSLLVDELHKKGIEGTAVAVGRDLDQSLAKIPSDVEAIYVSPLPRLSNDELKRLIDTLNERRIPTFSANGRGDVELGMLAGVAEKSDLIRRARRVALNIQAVLSGTPAAELPVTFDRREQLVINMATARLIGYSPAYRVLIEADLLNPEPGSVPRSLSLDSVVREAEGANLDLAAADRSVAAGLQLVKLARSGLLPQIDISGGFNVIDKDRTLIGTGQNPQRLAYGTLGGSQLLYSDDVWAGYTIEKRLQDAREESRATLRLDVVLEAAETYLNVLRTKTVERVQTDNLALTRANIELARVRVEVGQAGREELFRWESQAAANKRDVVDAAALRNQAAVALNRVLNRPIEESFESIETGLDDPRLVTSFQQIEPYINSPASFALFRNFMAQEAFGQSPELRQLEAEVLAQQREVTASQRSFYVPRVGVSATGTYLGRSGEGSKPAGSFRNLFFTNPWNWQIDISGTLPVFQGGAQSARLARAREQLQQTTIERDASRQRIEERLRSASHRTSAAYLGIELARSAAETAHRNLELVREQYAQGIAGILALLDAQNQALVADLAAANAVFDYLIELMRLQRAAGRFDYYRSAEDRQEFLNRMGEFFRNAGYEVHNP
jgi:outer membrane protein TolC